MVRWADVQCHRWPVLSVAATSKGAEHRQKGRGGCRGEQEDYKVSVQPLPGELRVDADNENRERNTTNLQLISDLCDLTVPAAALGYADLDDGIVGLAGTVSSLIGVWSTWKKTA